MPAINHPKLQTISAVFSKTEELVDFTRLHYWHYYRPHSKGKKEKFLMGRYFVVESTMWLSCPKGQRLPNAVKHFAQFLSYDLHRAKDEAHFLRLLSSYKGKM